VCHKPNIDFTYQNDATWFYYAALYARFWTVSSSSARTSHLHVCLNYENRFFNMFAHLTKYKHHIPVAVMETTV